jgi:hypothetical protein
VAESDNDNTTPDSDWQIPVGLERMTEAFLRLRERLYPGLPERAQKIRQQLDDLQRREANSGDLSTKRLRQRQRLLEEQRTWKSNLDDTFMRLSRAAAAGQVVIHSLDLKTGEMLRVDVQFLRSKEGSRRLAQAAMTGGGDSIYITETAQFDAWMETLPAPVRPCITPIGAAVVSEPLPSRPEPSDLTERPSVASDHSASAVATVVGKVKQPELNAWYCDDYVKNWKEQRPPTREQEAAAARARFAPLHVTDVQLREMRKGAPPNWKLPGPR